MKPRTLLFLPFLALANAASGQSLYLTCKTTAFPDLDFKKIYKSPPLNTREQFIRDMAMEGLLGVLVNRAESWEVRPKQATVSSPEDNSGPTFSNATISETKVSATEMSAGGSTYSYELNRITGKLTYRINLAEESRTSWQAKHGGSLPSIWKWEQLCTSASRPKI
jgi:hypothetical protein